MFGSAPFLVYARSLSFPTIPFSFRTNVLGCVNQRFGARSRNFVWNLKVESEILIYLMTTVNRARRWHHTLNYLLCPAPRVDLSVREFSMCFVAKRLFYSVFISGFNHHRIRAHSQDEGHVNLGIYFPSTVPLLPDRFFCCGSSGHRPKRCKLQVTLVRILTTLNHTV